MTGLLKRSVTLNGHRTSVSLEPEFWDEVKRLADQRGLSVNALISEIDHTRIAASGPSSGAVGLGFVTEQEFDEIVRPENMVGPSS